MNRAAEIIGIAYKYLCAAILATMTLTVFVNTVLRYGFNYGMAASEEMLRYLFIWISFLGIVAVYKTNSHISVTVVVEKLSEKYAFYLKLISDCVIIYALYVMIHGGLIYMSFNMHSLGQMIKIPFAWIIFSVVFAGITMGCMTIIEIYQLLKQKFSRG